MADSPRKDAWKLSSHKSDPGCSSSRWEAAWVAPLGIPPGPDDPVISRVAPENCVFYTTWAAVATPNPNSQNQAEKMLAEPEVRLFVDHLEKWVRHSVTQVSSDSEANSLSDATFDALLMVLRHQTAMFVSDVKFRGRRVAAKGGVVVALGSDALLARRLFYQHVHGFFVNLNAQSIETVSFYGDKWYRVKIASDFPGLLVGMKDSYLIVAVGEDSPDPIVQRMDRSVPRWLKEARRQAGLERPTGMTYINLRRLREAGTAGTDSRRQRPMDALGLAQLPWVMSASGLVGPDVVTRTILPIEGQPRGLLLAAEGRGLQREDLAAIPRDASMALAARFDLQKAWDALPVRGKARQDPREGKSGCGPESDGREAARRDGTGRGLARGRGPALRASAGTSSNRWATAGASTTRPGKAA